MTRRKAAYLLTAAFLAIAPALPASAGQLGEQVAPGGVGQEMLRLDVDTMTPRLVTTDTRRLTVTGRITNVGDRRVDEIQAKLQRGEPVTGDAGLSGLADLATDSASTPFAEVSGSLEPGESAELTLAADVRDPEQLALDRPGVYPLLVNVNGRPDFGGQARLAAVSIPLPVLAVPGGAPAAPKAAPPAVTILWPILDTQPRRLPATDGSTVLADDQLAESLSAGGRLFGLVNAVATATATNGTLLNSLCFAVDPDLLQTVSDMAAGYQVREETGRLVAGQGATAATDWLTRMAELTRGRCVLSVPFADADVVALSRSGAVDLAQLAALGSSSIVAEELAPVQPVEELIWPVGGAFDKRTLVDLAATGPTTVLADPAHLQKVTGRPPYQVTGTETAHPVRALPTDSLVSSSLNIDPPGAGADTSLQRGLAALTFRTLFDGRQGGQVLIAPPRRWTAPAAELVDYLDLAQRLFDGGYAVPRPLPAAAAEPAAGTTDGFSYTPQDNAREIPVTVTAEVARINRTKRDLLDAMGDDNTSDVDPSTLLSPVQYGLLRATSTAWRGDVRRSAAAVEAVDDELGALSDKVEVSNVSRTLALASGDSPIPVKVNNGLPVSIVVRIRLDGPPGLAPEPVHDVLIPPLSSRNHYFPTEVTRAGRFKVEASLSTPGGTKLGRTVQLELTSTSYGVITVVLTSTAGAVLVILVIRRIFRRVRGVRPGQGEPIVEGEARVEP